MTNTKKIIARIRYVDSFYTYKSTLPNGKLKMHEAYGYIEENNEDYIMTFIVDKETDINVSGLIIPKKSLISERMKNKGIFNEKRLVKILWEDVVLFEDRAHRTHSIFETTGTIIKDNKYSITISNPITKRIEPQPQIQHPVQIPKYYVIPKSLIIKHEYI